MSALLTKHNWTDLISAMVNRRMSVQIMPRMSFRFPSIISEALGRFETAEDGDSEPTFRTDVGEFDSARSDEL